MKGNTTKSIPWMKQDFRLFVLRTVTYTGLTELYETRATRFTSVTPVNHPVTLIVGLSEPTDPRLVQLMNRSDRTRLRAIRRINRFTLSSNSPTNTALRHFVTSFSRFDSTLRALLHLALPSHSCRTAVRKRRRLHVYWESTVPNL